MLLMLLAIIAAYFIGSIPTALWIGRRFRGIDIREHGSHNLGATNAIRVLGKKIGAIVLLLDILKGLAPVVLLPWLLGIKPVLPYHSILIGLATIAGHILSCFVNFRGGKGVATSLGVFLAIAPGAMSILLAIGIMIIGVTGYVSLASVIGAVLLPFLLYGFGQPPVVLCVGIVVAFVVIARHKGNILRLIRGEENSVWGIRPGPDDDTPIPTSPAPDSDTNQ